MEHIFAQILGFIGMACCILSFQCKSNRNYFVLQGTSGAFFAAQFLLTGAWSGLLFNGYNMLRAVVCECFNKQPRRRNLILLEVLVLGLALCSILVFRETWWLVVFTWIAQASGTYTMWTRNGKKIRLIQLAVVSPFWLLYDLLIPVPTIGGILAEVFNMTSVVISMLRFRKSGYDNT